MKLFCLIGIAPMRFLLAALLLGKPQKKSFFSGQSTERGWGKGLSIKKKKNVFFKFVAVKNEIYFG